MDREIKYSEADVVLFRKLADKAGRENKMLRALLWGLIKISGVDKVDSEAYRQGLDPRSTVRFKPDSTRRFILIEAGKRTGIVLPFNGTEK